VQGIKKFFSPFSSLSSVRAFDKVKIGIRASHHQAKMYSGSYEMPNCNACGKQVRPGELSESFACPKCRNVRIWRCEGCKGKSKKYRCPECGYEGK